MKLISIYPMPIFKYGIGYACLSITSCMSGFNLETKIISTSSFYKPKPMILTTLVPNLLNKVVYKLFSSKTILYFTESLYFLSLKKSDIAYVWPGVSLKLLERIKQKGCTVVSENINCHNLTAKIILDQECQFIKQAPAHFISLKKIQDENRCLALSDYVFSPSPLVTKSLLKNGVESYKILQTSYGLSQSDQLDISNKDYSNTNPITAIFVGRVGVRKGIHLLLDYWDSANINGTLKIIGNIEPPVLGLLERYQNHPKIEFVEFVEDLKELYRKADFFLLPSLEEGSPLVTYLAIGAGLPCIVSPMGGEGVINDQVEGFIIDPHDKEKWISKIQGLAGDSKLRQAQSLAAHKLSNHFLWDKVGQRRAAMLLDKLMDR